ncbi:hypothetical protein HTV80_11930 [Streptomyces sp. Vc74B-19]|uniref:hypothetical protein n=1 Tax=Streptomyces sp. Vc74B-19 TaxID=2741324 RepID=UPI001BFCA64E|nr:hypothetical protein [Streptomyces sp. Vc74B-19]MBT3163817.1 hypothetical protein [Streptomyces sp. Vc74B-19]
MLTLRFTPAQGIRTALLLCLCALAALLFTAPQARATSDDPVTAQASYLAERLRENPVHVTDQLPRVVPRSTAPDFARLAQRTGVPTYVVVLPYQGCSASEELLTAVHDRLGRDGLYVLIDETGVAAASDHGVNVPAEHAATAVQGELPYDAGPLLSFERFTDVVTLTPEEAEGRAEAASGPAPEGMYIGSAERDDQSFATGALLTGVPLSILLLAPLVHRWRRRRPSATPASLKRRRGLRHPLFLGTVAAVLAAGAIAGTASLVFDETKSSAAPPPTAADLSSRIERVGTGLRDDPVYLDPESRRFLDAPVDWTGCTSGYGPSGPWTAEVRCSSPSCPSRPTARPAAAPTSSPRRSTESWARTASTSWPTPGPARSTSSTSASGWTATTSPPTCRNPWRGATPGHATPTTTCWASVSTP